ncbi:MAG: hypothetical protein NTY59_03450 [Alphaproteobacteria bacterium]|nr:hypothetical protein [Alphaproteobacteria bacterium]
MTRFVELSREIFEGMGGINPRYAVRVWQFCFFAVPPRVRDATSFPIRAFAEILD